MKIIKITAGGASGAILVNYENMFASPKQIFLRKTSFTKVVQSRVIVLFEKIFVRYKTGLYVPRTIVTPTIALTEI